jgi:hypothetical protein
MSRMVPYNYYRHNRSASWNDVLWRDDHQVVISLLSMQQTDWQLQESYELGFPDGVREEQARRKKLNV